MLRKKAIVIGASIAGTLSARVLSAYFDQVIILERDSLSNGNIRKGTPQATHIHFLLSRGYQILRKLCPDIEEELLAHGAQKIDFLNDVRILLPTGWAPKFCSEVITYTCSRTLLEKSIRNKVLQNFSNITIFENCFVKNLILDETRVMGLEYQNDGKLDSIKADLVVDASGRNTKTPLWLENLGFQKPKELKIDSYVGYATRIYRKPPGEKIWKMLAILNRPTHNPRTGIVYPVENNQWIIGVSGIGGEYPPTDEEGFLDFIKRLPTTELYDSIKEAIPVSEIFGYRIEGSRKYQYEKLSRWPQNFIVIGDSVCTFNPFYGQGMTSAALCVEYLSKSLKQIQNEADWKDFSKQYQVKVSEIVSLPWILGTSDDLRWPTTKGKKPSLSVRFMQKYTNNVMLLIPNSELAAKSFLEMMHMTKSPSVLFHPKIIGQMFLKYFKDKIRSK